MKSFLLVTLILSVFNYVFAELALASLSPENIEKVNTLMEEALLKGVEKGPAISLAIVSKGKVLFEGAKGYKDLSDNSLADKYTGFGIASITKSFTSLLAVKMLHEKFHSSGENVLDSPIVELLPEYNFTLSDKIRTEKTTFRDLLSHRVCLVPEFLGTFISAYDGYEDYIFRQRFAKEKCGFRSGFLYNNGLYALSGDLLAFMGKEAYRHLIEDLVHEIGMDNTTFVKDDDDVYKIPSRAKPYRLSEHGDNVTVTDFNQELLKVVVFGLPAGGMISTANDMAKYMRFLLNEGKIDGKQIVPPEIIKWIMKPVTFADKTSFKVDTKDILDFDFAYALGLAVGIYDGYKRISHAGSLPPYESLMSLYPDLDLGIFTVSNGPTSLKYGLGQNELHAKIVDIIKDFKRPENSTLTFLKPPSNTKENAEKRKNGEKVEISETTLSNLTGHYGSLFSGDMEISLQNGTLNIDYGRWGQGRLKAYEILPSEIVLFVTEFTSDFTQFLSFLSIEGDPVLLAEFNEKEGVALFYIEGRKDTGGKFRKGFNSKSFLEDNRNKKPWELDY